MTNSEDSRLESTNTNGAYSKVGGGGDQDVELVEHSNQRDCKVSVDNSRELGPRTLREV